jgi:D-alanine-D-alanine ligase-like ATP-grasp enzyme
MDLIMSDSRLKIGITQGDVNGVGWEVILRTFADQRIVFNEINTLPGFTSISMYPKLFDASGIPYSQLLDRLLSYAMEACK